MITRLSHITLPVRDQDEALAWYVEKLGFEKRVDEAFGSGLRWLTIAPKGQAWPQIVLQELLPETQGESPQQAFLVRGAAWVLETDDCRKDYQELAARGVKFTSRPEEMPWGIQAFFLDLYGNAFVLVEPRAWA